LGKWWRKRRRLLRFLAEHGLGSSYGGGAFAACWRQKEMKSEMGSGLGSIDGGGGFGFPEKRLGCGQLVEVK
jgi:hypothetical protein